MSITIFLKYQSDLNPIANFIIMLDWDVLSLNIQNQNHYLIFFFYLFNLKVFLNALRKKNRDYQKAYQAGCAHSYP